MSEQFTVKKLDYIVIVDDDESYAETSAAALRAAGVTDYCNQVCGGGNCGGEALCQYGIDSKTHMPPEEGQR